MNKMKNTLIRLLVLALLVSGTMNLLAYSKSDPLEDLNTNFYGLGYTEATVDENGTLTIYLRPVCGNPGSGHHIYIANVDVENDISSD